MTPRSLDNAIALLRHSPKFWEWRNPNAGSISVRELLCGVKSVPEKKFAPAELAGQWGVSAETIRLIFRDEPGVFRFRQENSKHRKYVRMRIPESIAERVHRKFSAMP